jgi:hypothetical protein
MPLFFITTLFCCQHTVQLMTAIIDHVTNLTPGSGNPKCGHAAWSVEVHGNPFMPAMRR